ncbi:ABC transporter substrate-binding protein [Desulfosudis oleivorans]|uniref:Periplasmic binding protein n=1 Tax=Desulfosudis oleivorans (strain DSM 6200 / JCM 39069 / Hxd3) TaxID=96561 RepID=A8ZTT1_DESOH|nr:cobalamin-binding protein [Desulfosudis oleivorans]ABW67864.1 periplasmic binding protein [Desulfosudis oleivorans Hxd3]
MKQFFSMQFRRMAVVTALITFLCLPVAYAKTVTDPTGRTLEVPDSPSRVVSLAPSITEIIFALERQDVLKGVTQYSDYPPEALQLPRVGSYVHLDLERIVALSPDLCIAIKDGNPKQVADRLTELGIPVYAVNPFDLNTVIQTVEEMGTLLNATKKAGQLADSMRARINRIDRLVASIPHRPAVFFQIGISPIVSAGTDTFINELITRAGGKNLAAGQTPYPRFSEEELVGLAPDVVIITSMTRDGEFDRAMAQWRKWDTLPAIKSNRIHLIDSNLVDRPTPRIVEGLETLARLIHPELFSGTPSEDTP